MLSFLAVLAAGLAARPSPAEDAVVVASKPFAESYLLAEMAAQLLESHGIEVDRRLGLGTTDVVFQALAASRVDVYPEYTGTALRVVLGRTTPEGAREVYRAVARGCAQRFGVRWLPPLGFENTYAIAVRRATAERLDLATLSDLAGQSRGFVAGFSPDFVDRGDGLPGLARAYGLVFEDVQVLYQAVKHAALANDEVDVIDAYSTDGFLAQHDVVVLDDDRGFFPPYEAAYVVSRRLVEEGSRALPLLAGMSGRLDEALVRKWNAEIEVEKLDVARVAGRALAEIGLVEAPDVQVDERSEREGFVEWLEARRGMLLSQLARHVFLVAVSMLLACAVAIPLGFVLHRAERVGDPMVRALGTLQTIPGLALLAFMVPLFGIGVAPAIIALFLYSLLPVLRNTYTGLREVDRSAVRTAWIMGMTPLQLLLWVRLPLALPVIVSGIRTATVLNVGTSTLAAFVGAGGLGEPIVRGLAVSDTRMILSGAVPAALLALLADGALARLERATSLEATAASA